MKINNISARRTLLGLPAVALVLALTNSAVHATVYNAATDFSITTNGGTNPWSYGYTLGLGGTFIPFPNNPAGVAVNGSTFDIWRDNSFISSGVPDAFKNIGTVTSADNVLPGQFALHPGQTNSYAVLCFTAPTTDTYTLTSQYFVGNTGQTSIDVYKNSGSGSPLFSSATTSGSPVFNSTISLNASDKLYFAVGPSTDGFFADSTPLNVNLVSGVSAPEPTTIALLSLGGLGVLARRRKSGK
jgi:PEP-CTERM motif